jgi:phosphate transport system permease protein
MRRLSWRRRLSNHAATVLGGLCLVLAVGILVLIVSDTLVKAAPAFRGSGVGFLTGGYPIPCSRAPGGPSCSVFGGIEPALEGTFYILLFACGIALPVGILGGVFLSEYGRNPFGRTLSFLVDVLAGVPSIVVGIFVFSLVLIWDPSIVFSVISGGAALAIIMLPVVVRTTEESLKLVPQSTREAALALGIPRYRSILQIILPNGAGAVVTGAILAIARAGGESAPLLLLELQPRVGFTGWDQSVVPVPLLVYLWGFTQDNANWQADAWGAAAVLILVMLTLSLAARFILHRRMSGVGA